MQQQQLLYQRIVIFAALVLTCMVFALSLGFSTDLYSLNYHADPSSSLLYVKGAELYYQVQPFNKAFLRDAAIQLVLCVLLFVFLSHKRRLYYLSNYLTSLLFCGFAGYQAATLLVNAQYIRAKYLQIDFERMREITEMLNMRYTESTFMLDAAIALSYALFGLIACLMINLVWKSVWMRRERREARA